ncbi:MAG: nuclear transport factor 2 family protein [Pseudomonadota bacterium]
MKSVLLALALAFSAPSLAAATDGTAPAGDADTARVITLVASIPLAVDRAAYDLAEAAFAPEVVIDYTSLWGGEPSTMTPAALMDGWRGIVPGFDATWHELGPVEVAISGDTATALAQVDARHWIGDRLWRPVGVYRWDLARTEDGWRVTRMVFDMTDEIGDRSLTEEAISRAAK